MNAQGLNFLIVNDDQLVITGQRNSLANRFGTSLNISTFLTGKSALEKINKDTDIVILDYHPVGKNGNEILKSIKQINPKTKVIIFSCNGNIGVAIDSFRNGTTDYVAKGEKALRKL